MVHAKTPVPQTSEPTPIKPSSIEKMKKIDEPLHIDLHTPKLIPPSSSFTTKYAELTLLTEKIKNDIIRLDQISLERHFARIREWEKAELLKIQEAAEKSQSWNTWNFLKEIGSFLLSIISIFVGFFFLSTGGATVIGGALVVSEFFYDQFHFPAS